MSSAFQTSAAVRVCFLAFFIDLSMVSYEKNRLFGVIVSNLEIIVNSDIRDIDEINDIYIKNGVSDVNILIDDNTINLVYDGEIKSLFGKILDFDIYRISLKYIGDYRNKEVYKYE